MDVRFHHEARAEYNALPLAEKLAMRHVIDKLEQEGDRLATPHSRNVVVADRLRELRPRAGRSPWRAFYRRIGAGMVVGGFGPEAQANPRGFVRAVRMAAERLNRVEQGEGR
jgi:hypothetical protein